MSKLSKKFNENVEYFLQENKNEYSKLLEKKNTHLRKLLKKTHKFVNELLEEKDDKIKLEDEFFDWFYEILQIESMFLYKQGFKDCYKILRLLGRN